MVALRNVILLPRLAVDRRAVALGRQANDLCFVLQDMRRRAQRKGLADVDERELVVVQRAPAVRLDINIVVVVARILLEPQQSCTNKSKNSNGLLLLLLRPRVNNVKVSTRF